MNLSLRWEGGSSSIDHPLREVRSERLSAVSAKIKSPQPIALYLEGRRRHSSGPSSKRIFRYASAVDAFLPSDTKLWAIPPFIINFPIVPLILQTEGRRIPHGDPRARIPQQAFLTFICKTREPIDVAFYLLSYHTDCNFPVKLLLIFI
jgi:hypothetical protein